MNIEKFEELMSDSEVGGSLLSGLNDCNVFLGLKIMKKYIPSAGIEGAEHDVVYSVDIEELIKAGISEEDVIMLNKLNWMVEDDYLACCV